MKRLLFILFALVATTAIQAQLVQEREFALVYYMPETHLVFDIEYTEEIYQAGPYYLFADKYLGTYDVIQEDHIVYHLGEVRTRTRTVPDYTRAYKVTHDPILYPQLLTLTHDGLLYGYNVPLPEPTQQFKSAEEDVHFRADKINVLPLMEEQILAPTLQQKAELAAKQIYRIRETRMYILSGEIDHVPADGKAIEIILKELNRQEKALTELFIGKKIVRHHLYTMSYIPTGSTEFPLLYFSPSKGITTEDEAEAQPLMLTIVAHKQSLIPIAEPPSRKDPLPSQIYYNLPGSADFALNYHGQLLVTKSLPISQFGVAVPLAQDLFTGVYLPIIYFNTQTGNIHSLQLTKPVAIPSKK